jgi:hypothetical protein
VRRGGGPVGPSISLSVRKGRIQMVGSYFIKKYHKLKRTQAFIRNLTELTGRCAHPTAADGVTAALKDFKNFVIDNSPVLL